MAEYGARFTDPLLRRFFGSGLNEMSAMAILMSLAWMNNKNAGYPIGGSPAFIKPIEENFLALGGRIRFKAAVKTITAQDGRASGVVLENGERIAADAVVSAADGQATIFKMLEGKYISPSCEPSMIRMPCFLPMSKCPWASPTRSPASPAMSAWVSPRP